VKGASTRTSATHGRQRLRRYPVQPAAGVVTRREESMHGLTKETEQLGRQVLELVLASHRQDPRPLGGVATAEELARRVGPTITPAGLGGPAALRRWVEELGPATVAADHPRYLAFIPHAPTEVAVLFDLLVGASGIYGGSWLEAAGAVFAENEALR
jgi:L-2,4-diaminobutyrate decarboxylase